MGKSSTKKKIIALALVLAGGYYYYASSKTEVTPTSYILGTAQKGTIITTVAGTGQVLSSNQVDIKPLVSAYVTKINVKQDQAVKAGDVLVQLDDKDLRVQVKNAKNSLDSARANLAIKLAGPTAENEKIQKNSVNTAKLAYDNAVKNLDTVKKTVEQNIKKAELSVANAKLSIDNAQRQYDDALVNTDLSKTDKDEALDKAYEDAKTTINSSYISLRSAYLAGEFILDNNDTVFKNALGVTNAQSLSGAEAAKSTAKYSYDAFERSFNAVSSGGWDKVATENLLQSTLRAMQDMKDFEHAVYSALLNTVSSISLPQSTIDSYKSQISSHESAMVSGASSIQNAQKAVADAKQGIVSGGVSGNSSISSAKSSLESAKNNLISVQNNLEQAKMDGQNSITSAQNDIVSKKSSWENSQAQYDSLMAKPRDIDLVSARVQISQAQISYEQAVENLKNAQIISPIDGVIAKIYLNVGDLTSDLSNGEPVVTVITPQQLASITVNEVDAAKLKLGQKSNMTFSALEGLEMTGVVTNVDTIGTVSSGVVNYTVKIAFDTIDDTIKPQMSVSATIITDQRLNVLTVANEAIKTDNAGESYVEYFKNADSLNKLQDGSVTSAALPERKTVVTGLANDTETEIISGLSDGDSIVIQTNNASAGAAKTQTNSGLNILGGGAGGGAMRMR